MAVLQHDIAEVAAAARVVIDFDHSDRSGCKTLDDDRRKFAQATSTLEPPSRDQKATNKPRERGQRGRDITQYRGIREPGGDERSEQRVAVDDDSRS